MDKYKEEIICEGKRIYLRRLREEDVQGNYSRWLNDEKVSRQNAHHRYPNHKENLLAYVKSANQAKNIIIFAIIHNETGAYWKHRFAKYKRNK